MRKIYKKGLLVIIIQLIFMLFLNTHVSALYKSLEEFVEKNGLENMSATQLEAKQTEAINKISDDRQKRGVQDAVSTILYTIDGEYDSYEEKMSKLNEAFLQNQGDPYGDEAQSDLYYGYMLGGKWVIYKGNASESKKNDTEGKTAAEQFDEKYDEYKKLKDEDKNINTLLEYQSALQTLYKQLPRKDQTEERLLKLDEVDTAVVGTDHSSQEIPDTIYQYPDQKKPSSAGSLDDMIGDADKFISSAKGTAISASSLQNFSKTFYNIFLTIGIIVAVLVGSILGIKFMVGGAGEKAHIKELLVPYIVGCIVIFGAFAIWKIVVTILSNSLA